MSKMNEQVNRHVFLADIREKYYNEIAKLVQTIFIKMSKNSKALTKEIQKYTELQTQKKAAEGSSQVKQELHIKSVMFERDNL